MWPFTKKKLKKKLNPLVGNIIQLMTSTNGMDFH